MIKRLNVFSSEKVNTLRVLKDFLKSVLPAYGEHFILKGYMALSTYLEQDTGRQTTDIDLAFLEESAWKDFTINCTSIATNNSELGIKYELVKIKDTPNGGRLFIKAKSDRDIVFNLDMNYPKDRRMTLKSFDGLSINVFPLERIIVDKISVVTKIKVNRRVKDLIDLFLIASNYDFEYSELMDKVHSIVEIESRDLSGTYLFDLANSQMIKHSYDSYDNVNKPEFGLLIDTVREFILPIVDETSFVDSTNRVWSKERLEWL